MDDQYTFENKTYKDTYRHTTSHILAQAMKRLYPEVKLAIGPAIEDGFYYDFDSPQPFTPEVLEKLEAEMRKICKEKLRLERFELPRAEALKFMEERDEPYKIELINDLPEDAVISFYRQGEFVDLCAGPHLDSTGRVKGNAIKLTSVTGAYWRGDSSRKMLQRIYGTCFPKKEELDAYLARIEEAKKRDHRKLGKELGLFTFMDEGPGFPFFLPNGMVLKNQLIDYWREIHKKAGYVEISTPIMLNQDLWHRSGHWDHYKDNMYTTVIDDEDYAKQFEETAKRFGKGEKYDERKYYHFKLSCARKDNVTPEKAHAYAEEVAEAFFKNYECVIATHTDTQTVHSHIIVNAVDPITGKKLQFSKQDYAKMKDEVNAIGRKYGFTETEFVVQYKCQDKTKHSRDHNNGNGPYKCIFENQFKCRTSEDFCKVVKSTEAFYKSGLTHFAH